MLSIGVCEGGNLHEGARIRKEIVSSLQVC